MEQGLQFPCTLPRRTVAAANHGRVVGIEARHVVGEPGAGSGRELLNGFDVSHVAEWAFDCW